MTPRSMAMMAIFVGPAACASAQLASYVLVYRVATLRGDSAFVRAPTLVATGLMLAAIVLSLRTMRSQQKVHAGVGIGGVDRFLAVTALAMNVFFLVVVVVGFGLPQWVLDPSD